MRQLLIYLMLFSVFWVYGDDEKSENKMPKRIVPLEFIKKGISLRSNSYSGIEQIAIQVKNGGEDYNIIFHRYFSVYTDQERDEWKIVIWSHPIVKPRTKFNAVHPFKSCIFDKKTMTLKVEAQNGFKASIVIKKGKAHLTVQEKDKKEKMIIYQLVTRDDRIQRAINKKFEEEVYWSDGEFPAFENEPLKYKVKLEGNILKIEKNSDIKLVIPKNVELKMYNDHLMILKTKKNFIEKNFYDRKYMFDFAIIYVTEENNKPLYYAHQRCLNTGGSYGHSEFKDINKLLKMVSTNKTYK